MFSEMMIKNLLKAVDFEKLQQQLLSDPRVNQAMEIANSIRNDFETIKLQNAEILSRLDEMKAGADIAPAKRKKPLSIEDQTT